MESGGRSQSRDSAGTSNAALGEQQWHALGEVQYRKWSVYSLGWSTNTRDASGEKIKLENYKVCASQFGGPVALVREDKSTPSGSNNSDTTNTTTTTAASSSSSNKPRLAIYTSSGLLIAEGEWQQTRPIAGMGWSDQEQLIAVLDDGTVLTFDIKAKLTRSFSLLDSNSAAAAAQAASASGGQGLRVQLLEVHFWGSGLVALAGDMQAYVAEGLASPDPTSLPRRYKLRTTLTPERPYTSMAIVPPLLSRSGLLEVFLGTIDNSVLVCDENDVEDQLLQDRITAPITKMVVQPNGRYLACYRRDGVLTVMSSTFTTKVLDFNTKSISKPLDIAWCGEDSVVLLWRNTGVVMVGPFGDWLNFPYSESVHLVAESDCVRILTSSSCDMIQRVPPTTEAIRRIGSTDPAALMFDAMEAFEEGDPKSDENIRSIAASSKEALNDAVSACISAAAAEFDVVKQQAYLKAAAYGKAFSCDIDPQEFVDTALKLRVLNEVRRPSVGIPLTIQQYNRLTPEVLISRLTCRDLHLLALKVCSLLRLRPERVLVHWASEKVKRLAPTSASDEEIADTIRRRLQAYPRVSFLEVAAAAYQMHRTRLATIILDMETHAADQVPLLLSMQEDELALQKSINSEDTDLIYLVLIHLERSRPDIESFYRLVHAHPEASNLLKMYYRCKVVPGDRTLLHKLLLHNKQYLEAGISAVAQAYMPGTSDPAKLQYMREASSLFDKSRELAFLKTQTDEQIELLEIQKTLEIRSAGKRFVNLSLSETLYNIVLLGIEFPTDAGLWEREIGKIVKKFKVSDKIVYHTKIQAFSRAGQWAALSILANEKRSPVGYRPFAQACILNLQPASEIERYIDKMAQPEERFDLYVDICSWRKAFEQAKALRDPARMTEVLGQCRDLALERQIQEALAKL